MFLPLHLYLWQQFVPPLLHMAVSVEIPIIVAAAKAIATAYVAIFVFLIYFSSLKYLKIYEAFLLLLYQSFSEIQCLTNHITKLITLSGFCQTTRPENYIHHKTNQQNAYVLSAKMYLFLIWILTISSKTAHTVSITLLTIHHKLTPLMCPLIFVYM